MFYKLLYDFGYLGFIPLVIFMDVYYCATYNKVMIRANKMKFDFRLFIYAYLFNDLIMSAFSNRFYDTVFHGNFIKFVPITFLLYCVVVESRIKINRYRGTLLIVGNKA